MSFDYSYNNDRVIINIPSRNSKFLGFLQKNKNFQKVDSKNFDLAIAIADISALADELKEPYEIHQKYIILSHRLVGSVDSQTAKILNLPPITDLVLKTDVEGIVGSSSFRLRAEWHRNNQHLTVNRIGSIIETSKGRQRIPAWMMDVLNIADGCRASNNDSIDWDVLARFRQALDLGAENIKDGHASCISMTDFLSGLHVRLADRFSISPNEQGTDFKIIPFSGQKIDDSEEISENIAELKGLYLADFQRKLKQKGVLNTFRLSSNEYLVIDRAAKPVLKLLHQMQEASLEERKVFIRNPLPRLTQAIKQDLYNNGKLSNIDDLLQEELIEKSVLPAFIETIEYNSFSERVIGIGKFVPPDLGINQSTGTTWLPEVFGEEEMKYLRTKTTKELEDLETHLEQAIRNKEETVIWKDMNFSDKPNILNELRCLIISRDKYLEDNHPLEKKENLANTDSDTIVLKTQNNFEEAIYSPAIKPRFSSIPTRIPSSIVTPLKQHQRESFDWQVNAWKFGLSGIFNADEQGLGKTLQTISFLVWLNELMEFDKSRRAPILIVAPTSLLHNWENEVDNHVEKVGLGHIIRLYGRGIDIRRRDGTSGIDTKTGESLLDFEDIMRHFYEGNGHFTCIITTYTTLTNYQHSLSKIPFAVTVFDEIQALKNPASLRSQAARSINADFRIGLTGTPIENSTTDLWAIMDQLVPGHLSSLLDYQRHYSNPTKDNMKDLYQKIFCSTGQRPALALRRLKANVTCDLPSKTRLILPKEMPEVQAKAYDDIRKKLKEGQRGNALKLLHHIRTASVHPAVSSISTDQKFIAQSGRLAATFEILKRIKTRGERALVFIENLKMQYRFAALVRSEFGLERVEIINGQTSISERQKIVDRFQEHLKDSKNKFDLLILGPRAAGTGLTLTAATHVIHLSRWWNPAVEEQCNDRVHRLGQTQPVYVYVPMAIHPYYKSKSFDCLLHNLMQKKRRLAQNILWPMADTANDVSQLQAQLINDENILEVGDCVKNAMIGMYADEDVLCPTPDNNGAFLYI
ncbi:DEAD/DEAH box helicase [Zymomonas mobilis]|uniref:SNF2-related protein n=1 Tax=Zymomonas mobilis subsp. pomaceae (strain ATCC 29192 / DSM 22645 / JCM 10191 / CCUG 17912 / NBRC 13757 / NCIMB 11200 / NRRL B-4491 / Barker I) TaxID=579138 RepID=F8EWF0_ZYMMT|nr:DEAD/DEAH box helicase [Zymomonas mobilis]AEI38593.1 SNF2-related protein [Zymomonas mobilis subsp. pomaceae ATCC 29192]MDX5949544.1 DEAD/DEAH box helicase [Zymomonas mobilis subsp. pomaceae]GEB89996.1 superfamily II DNA/RNA helicase and SNF2 family-related protein [Zymomonas mobilis subsp. pomaceae]